LTLPSIPARARRSLLSVGLGALVAGLGWRRSALSADGALAATAVGAATFGCGGWPAGLSLIAFFVTGSALSRRKSVPGELPSAKGHRRDAVQVLANGGFGALGAALAAAGWPRGYGLALGALATAAADTWASEIGVRSPSPPRSVATGEVLRPGASGGVTPLGWVASAAGALLIGAVWTLARRAGSPLRSVGVALVAGMAGALADSLAGATVQAAYPAGSVAIPRRYLASTAGCPGCWRAATPGSPMMWSTRSARRRVAWSERYCCPKPERH
jgi:uncharacterized protein (TIGR00297 family)